MKHSESFLADFYELAMANGFLSSQTDKTVAVFDMVFRNVPDNGGFAVMAGVEQLITELSSLSFTEEELAFFEKSGFKKDFIDYFRNFRFSCDVYAVPEGTPIFPGEPIIKVKGPVLQAQLIETLILNTVNFQSLIATKANRIVRAAAGKAVYETGARRAHGYDAALYGARAAYIAGTEASGLYAAGMRFGIPLVSMMTHSWVQMFESEYDAFCAYLHEHTDNGVLVVDTYNTLSCGVPNAIKAFNDVLVPLGKRPGAIVIDSGDITYLSKRARRLLDAAGFPDCEIIASNMLDETIIRDMLIQGAKIDAFSVGERLITSASSPLFGGTYKLSETERNGRELPAIMVSDNVAKITNPCQKRVWRLFDMETGKAIADIIGLKDEAIDEAKSLTLFDPIFTWKKKTVDNFVARELLVPIFRKGECVYSSPSLPEIRSYCKGQVATLWEEVTRFENPHAYYVDLSEKLWNEKQKLLEYRAQ